MPKKQQPKLIDIMTDAQIADVANACAVGDTLLVRTESRKPPTRYVIGVALRSAAMLSTIYLRGLRGADRRLVYNGAWLLAAPSGRRRDCSAGPWKGRRVLAVEHKPATASKVDVVAEHLADASREWMVVEGLDLPEGYTVEKMVASHGPMGESVEYRLVSEAWAEGGFNSIDGACCAAWNARAAYLDGERNRSVKAVSDAAEVIEREQAKSRRAVDDARAEAKADRDALDWIRSLVAPHVPRGNVDAVKAEVARIYADRLRDLLLPGNVAPDPWAIVAAHGKALDSVTR
jgi:hypothetical protein